MATIRSMHLGNISFCGRTAYNLKDDEDKKAILADVEATFGVRIIQRHYEPYSSSHDKNLTRNPHLLCIRSNGNPYFLYITTYQGVPACFFIDKKIQQGYFYPRIITTKLLFDDDLATRTLMDGEMVRDSNGEWTYLLHDLIGIAGTKLVNTNLVKRLNVLHWLLENKYRELDGQVCHLLVKRHVPLAKLQDLKDMMSGLNYTCRGVYVRPLFLKFRDVLINFDSALITKPAKYRDKSAAFAMPEGCDPVGTEIVMDSGCRREEDTPERRRFMIRKTARPDVYDLFDPVSGAANGQACVAALSTSRMLRTAFEHACVADRLAFDCEFNAHFSGWTPVAPAAAAGGPC